MEPFGFAHLRLSQTTKVPQQRAPKIIVRRSIQVEKGYESTSKLQKNSFSTLYFPVNTPPCAFQKQLAIDALKNNLLIALPKAMDLFLIASVVAFNFRRWFPAKKILVIASSSETASGMMKDFISRTGFTKSDVCVYGASKKAQRLQEWQSNSVVFATAESLISDFKCPFGEDIGLLIIDQAERAASGAHSVCALVRNLLLSKAIFRILAFTDCHQKKAAILQSMVMNLQIGAVRSTGQLLSSMLLTVSSPRLTTQYVSVTEEVNNTARELVDIAMPMVTLLYESGVLPTKELRKLVNFSVTYLNNRLNEQACCLASIFQDLADLLNAYDILMCEGLTAFAFDLQEKIAKSENIRSIIEASYFVKTACLIPDLSIKTIRFHKLEPCFAIIERSLLNYGRDKSVIVILCRDRFSAWVKNFISAVAKRFQHRQVNIISGESGYGNIRNLSESSMKFGVCNLIIIPCSNTKFTLNVGYVDTLICLDEGLSLLHYINGIQIGNEGCIYSLCTSEYEVNVCQLDSTTYAIDTVQNQLVNAVNLCRDNTKIFDSDWSPVVREYWADIDNSEESGLLSTFEEIEYNENLEFFGGQEVVEKNSLSCREILASSVDDSLVWLDKAQKGKEVGPSATTLTFTKIIGAKDDELKAESDRLRREPSMNDTLTACFDELDSSTLPSSFLDQTESEQSVPHVVERSRKRKPRLRQQAPPVRHLASASITSLLMKTNEVSADNFFDPYESLPAYCERSLQMEKITKDLRKMIHA